MTEDFIALGLLNPPGFELFLKFYESKDFIAQGPLFLDLLDPDINLLL